MHTPTEYAVFFTGPDNGPAFRRVGSLEEAVQVVEHLRNELGVLDANVHSLSPVPLSFRAYYRVEVPGQGEAPVVEAGDLDAVPYQPASYEPAAYEPAAYEPADAFAQTVQVSFASDLEAPLVADEEHGFPVAELLSDGAEMAAAEGDEAGAEIPVSPLGRSRYDGEERTGRMGFFAR
jgi:hypothetical protein